MCKVTIGTVNGVVPPNAADPTQLQITGTFQSCAANSILVTVKDSAGNIIAGPSAATSVNAGTGGWAALLSVAAGAVTCGSSLSVTAECASDSTCQATLSVMSLPCCDLHVVEVIGVVFPGALEPGAIDITGWTLGCFGGQVTITVTDNAGNTIAGPVTVLADAITGTYAATLTVTGTVDCFTKVTVRVACTQNPNCFVNVPAQLDCPPCNIRAQVGASMGTCSGTPPQVPVTLSSTIAVPKGAIECYRWVYGDGSSGPVFQVPPTGGATSTGNNTYSFTEPPHSYAIGNFTAKLEWVDCGSGSPSDDHCPPITLPISTTCCPVIVTITSVTVGPCTGNGTASVTINFTVSGVPSPWTVELAGLVNGVPQMPTGNFSNGSSSKTFPVASATGSASIGLRIVNPTGCPDSTRKVSIPPCPCCVPTANLRCAVMGCAPGATITFDLNSTAPWNWPTGCTPQQAQATSFDLEISSNGVTLFRRTTATLPVSSQDNAWVDFSTGQTGPLVLPATGGTFTVGVLAHLTGLTCASSQGSASFTVPPCCPQLTALTGFISASNPCSVDFAATVIGNTAGATFAWTFSDGSSATTSSPNISHAFPSGTTSAGAVVTLTVTTPNCPPQTTSTMVTLNGCACPTVTLAPPSVSGCIDATHTASVTFSAGVTPPVTGTSINWTVTTPAGASFTKSTPGVMTTDGTADGAWTNGSNGSTGALDVTATGSYAVAISATGLGIPSSCTAPAPRGFSIPACSGPSTNWGCVALRWIAVFLFIVAGFSWLVYFCMGPVLAATPYTAWIPYVLLAVAIAATVAAVVILVIWLLLPICTGKPCRWALLLWWQISIGFGTTALYLINCCGWTLIVGIISIVIGIAVLIWWWVSCKRNACQVAVELAPVLAAVIALIGYVNLVAPGCLNAIVGVIVGTISAGLTIALAACAASGTGPSGN